MINDTIVPCSAGLQKPFNLCGKEVNNLAEDKKKKIKKDKTKIICSKTRNKPISWLLILTNLKWKHVTVFVRGLYLSLWFVVCECFELRIFELVGRWCHHGQSVTDRSQPFSCQSDDCEKEQKLALAMAVDALFLFYLISQNLVLGNDVTFSLWAQRVRKVRCKFLRVPKLRYVGCCKPNVTDTSWNHHNPGRENS